MSEYTNPYAGMTTEELEAAFTAEDPRYPARKAAAEALHTFVNEWVEDYELDDGEHRPHAPSEFEQFLILDAFHGLTADDEYQRLDAAWRALCGPLPSQQTAVSGAVDADTKRLDFLDAINARKNAQNGTTYGWKLEENHNRIALSDHNWPALDVRAAIDAAIASQEGGGT